MQTPNPRSTAATKPPTIATAKPAEAPLQAYIRFLHETEAQQNDNQEPARGKDPWLGVGS